MNSRKKLGGNSSRQTDGKELFTLPPEDEMSLYHRLFENVRTFLLEMYPVQVEEAYSSFAGVNQFEEPDLDEEDFDDLLMIQFTDWMIHTYGVILPDTTGIEIYTKSKTVLGPRERDMLSRMSNSLVTLCEMQLSESHDRVLFNDLFLDTVYEIPVGERMPEFPEGLLAAVRVIPFSGGPALGLGSYPFLVEKELLLDLIGEMRENYIQNNPGSTMEDFLRDKSPLLDLWFDYMEEIADEDGSGEDAPMFLAHFTVTDLRGVRKRLKANRDLDEWQTDSFDWLGDPGEDGEPDFRGEVTLVDGQLVLSAASEELREAGKVMLLSTCRGLIQHTGDSIDTGDTDED